MPSPTPSTTTATAIGAARSSSSSDPSREAGRDDREAAVLTAEVTRLAGQMLAPFMVGAGSSIAQPVAQVAPYAFNVGAGGLSSGTTLPPMPGPVERFPLASAPPPKESDTRAVPGQLANVMGFGSPVAFAGSAMPQPTTSPPALPYFLEIAGPPDGNGANRPIDPREFPRLDESHLGWPHAPQVTSPGAAPVTAAPPYPPPSSSSPRPGPAEGSGRRQFDAASIKRDFPLLRERVHGRPLVWLDNAATTQKPQSVIDRLSYFYEHENSNIHRAAHTLAARSTDAYEGARDKVRRFINASSPQEIVFTRGATEAINLVAQSWGRRNIGAGDQILITWLEHHANIVPWQQLCSERGARLCVAPVDDRGQVILEEFERLLNPRTRLVSFTQVSNALGSILPARQLTEMAHRHGAVVLIDGAQAVSHMAVDVQELDCDFYCFSGHKVFAPTGIGALYGKSAVLEAMPPWQGGGNMIREVTFEKTSYQGPPMRFEAGTGSIGDAVALGAALDYVTALGIDNIGRHEHELLEYATHRLGEVPGLRLIGTAAEKAGVLSFVIDGLRTEDVGGELDQEGIAVRSGHHCAQPILRRFGVDTSVRASLAPYNTREDIDALVTALQRLQSHRR